MIRRVEVSPLSDGDSSGANLRSSIRNLFGIELESVKVRKVYTISADISPAELDKAVKELFCDRITETTSDSVDTGFDWLIEVGYKPGVTDNVGRSSRLALEDLLGRKWGKDEGVFTSVQYLVKGNNLSKDDIERISRFCLGTNPSTGANPIINSLAIMSFAEFKEKGIHLPVPVMMVGPRPATRECDIDVDDEELSLMSMNRVLSLNVEEMRQIKNHFMRSEVREERRSVGLTSNPTDVEIETIAQTWSEHCKHKIFNAVIEYHDHETGVEETIQGLFATYIRNPSQSINAQLGWVVSSFLDNAGVVRFNQRLNVVDKMETHNAPSALDPYGGAITGIVGVNRDPMGTGKGADLILNIYGYCFGDPGTRDDLPEGVLHPRIVRDGVHKGVIDGGNQSGIPLAQGREFFDRRFTFRPLVFCGTIGKMPVEINHQPSHQKKADPGDLIVMVGGRVGKDGIHGATFSSAELHRESPIQAVQIGDPIMQKMMNDFLTEARDLGLYKCITDNGAGGLSSSVGEMATSSGGCELDLERVPLKYQGLADWEILLSEAQERMTVAVSPDFLRRFLELAKERDVEATVLGTFTDTGKFHVTYGVRTVAYLDMDFLHNGLPKMRLRADWSRRQKEEPDFDEPHDLNRILEEMLARLNICSKEFKLRQYDHEVKGMSVIKPLCGAEHDVPSDATISLLEYGSREGLIVSEGLNPHYSDIDTYDMAASVIDEAIRRVIAVGGSLPSRDNPFYALDNFCWNMSRLEDDDGKFKLSQLVRANKALSDYCLAFGVPCVSGKDSMKNVWKIKPVPEGGESEDLVSIPPTLLFSVRSKIADVENAVTMDVKSPGDLVYVVGCTYDETGGSEYYQYMGEGIRGTAFVGNKVPKVRADTAKEIYGRLSKATQEGIVRSIHTPTVGGLGVALALSAIAGGHGMEVELGAVPRSGVQRDDVLLFSESNSRFVVTVGEQKKEEFERIVNGIPCACIGKVSEDDGFRVRGLKGDCVIDSDISRLRRSWKARLSVM